MRRERRQALFNALFVTDICKHLVENTDFGPVVCRDRNSCHRHENKKSACLKRYRLTARIRTRDDKRIITVSDLDIDGNYAFLRDQRVSCSLKIDPAFGIKLRAE